jgi:molybdopterin-synthase adenylyltransferase
MMPDDIGTSPTSRKMRIKLADRFQVLKISNREYKFASLSESTVVRIENATDQVLDVVLTKLQRGSELEEILQAVDTSQHQIVFGIIRDLSARSLLREEPVSSSDSNISNQERDIYREQAKFFSNFRPYSMEPTPTGSIDLVDSSVLVQRKLKASSVMLVGLGRIGSRLATGLAHMGLGQLYGSDPLQVTNEDTTDSGYSLSDVGSIREEVLKSMIKQVNHFIKYVPMGIGSVFEQDPTMLPNNLDLLVLCEDRFNPDHYGVINRFCLDRQITWTSYRNLGLRFEVGPMIVPRETACFKCLELRKAANLYFYEDFLATQRNLLANSVSLGSLNITLGYEALALEVIKILTNFSRPVTYGSVFSFDVVGLTGKLHPVLKIPRCPACSNVSRDRPTFSIWRPDELFKGL